MNVAAGDAVAQPSGPAAGEIWAYRARRQDPLDLGEKHRCQTPHATPSSG